MSDDDDQNQGAADPTQPTVDATAPGKQRRRIDQEQAETEIFWQRVLADPVGRRVMWGLLTDGHFLETRFACGPSGFPQAEATWFHAGEQDFALRLYHALIKYDRSGVFVMHDEHDPRFVAKKRSTASRAAAREVV